MKIESYRRCNRGVRVYPPLYMSCLVARPQRNWESAYKEGAGLDGIKRWKTCRRWKQKQSNWSIMILNLYPYTQKEHNWFMQHKRKKNPLPLIYIVSLFNLINEFIFFLFGKVISKLVLFLLFIKFILPIVNAKPREVTCCDRIIG